MLFPSPSQHEKRRPLVTGLPSSHRFTVETSITDPRWRNFEPNTGVAASPQLAWLSKKHGAASAAIEHSINSMGLIFFGNKSVFTCMSCKCLILFATDFCNFWSSRRVMNLCFLMGRLSAHVHGHIIASRCGLPFLETSIQV